MFVVTFYSYKGGVGRTMAMANCAELLAQQGHRVLVIDWDLEAPGLERYLMNTEESAAALWRRSGVIDLVRAMRSYAAGRGETVPNVADYLVPMVRPSMDPGKLFVMTAGRREGDQRTKYSEFVQEFDWAEFYEKWSGGMLLDNMLDQFEQQEFDYVLIDSRTGVTELGGVCTHHLADCVVMVMGTNDVNLEASAWMNHALHDSKVIESRDGRPLVVLPVAARVEKSAEKERYTRFLERFEQLFSRFLPADVHEQGHLRETQIPYIPFYALVERVVAREAPAEAHPELLSAYVHLVDSIKRVRCAAHPDVIERKGAQAGQKLSQEKVLTLAEIDRHAAAWKTVLTFGYFSPLKMIRWVRLADHLEQNFSLRMAVAACAFSLLAVPLVGASFLAGYAAWSAYQAAQADAESTIEHTRMALEMENKRQKQESKEEERLRLSLETALQDQKARMGTAQEALRQANLDLLAIKRDLEAVEKGSAEKADLERRLSQAYFVQEQRQTALNATREALEVSRQVEAANRAQLKEAERRKRELATLLERREAQVSENTAALAKSQELARKLQSRLDQSIAQERLLRDQIEEMQARNRERLEAVAQTATQAAEQALEATE